MAEMQISCRGTNVVDMGTTRNLPPDFKSMFLFPIFHITADDITN